MKARILGSGGASGVPLIGDRWGRCDPNNPKNRRSRSSLLVSSATVRCLVDTSPDLRSQLLQANVSRVDAILYTHAHADHCHGIDDVREVCHLMKKPLDCYAHSSTIDTLTQRFSYCFQSNGHFGPYLIPHPVETPFQIGDLDIIPIVQDHGFSLSLGYRFGPLAYSIDVKYLDETACSLLRDLDVWIVDCVRIKPKHPVHFVLEDVLEYVERLTPKRTILTHLSTDIDYETLTHQLPERVDLAYDGMEITFDKDH